MRRAAAVLALALMGCGGAEAEPGVVVRDSAGVAIVDNGAETLEAAGRWTLAGEPSLDLRSQETGEPVLFDVGDVLPLSGGGVAVANRGSSEVLVFGADGALVRRLGGEGDGPGEFRAINSLMAFGDSLAVFDGGQRRLSVFGPGGALAREVPLAELSTERASYDLLPLASGDLVLFASGGLRPESGRFRTEAESFRVGRGGERRSSYGRFPGSEMAVFPGGAGQVLFGAVTDAATAGDRLVVGLGETTQVVYHGPEGALARIVRWPDRPLPVPPERIQAFLEAGLAEAPEAQHEFMRSFFEQIPVAERLPPYEDLIGSPSGELLVGDYVGPERRTPDFREPAREWLVIGPDGAIVARMASPEGFAVRAFSYDVVWGVFTDELGVESVRAYPLRRASGG